MPIRPELRHLYTRRPWTAEEIAIVETQYADQPTREIAAQLGRTVQKVYQKAQKLGLHKSSAALAAQYDAKRGKSTPEMQRYQFPKGHVPANAGKKMPGWAPGRMAETQFKPGEMAGAARAKWKPIGTMMPDSDGYLRIKLRERDPGAGEHGWNSKVWAPYHRYLWEQANGPIPAGHALVFRDRNRTNCTLENLELISRADLARRNQIFNSLPRELAEAIQLAGALKRKIRRRSEKEESNGKEQNG